MTTQANTPTSLTEILWRLWSRASNSGDKPFEENKANVADAIAAISALVPEKDTRKHAISGADEFIQIGWNMAIEQTHHNFTGQTANERKQA